MAECAEPIPGPATEYFGRLASEHNLYIVAGLTERVGIAIYNTAALVGPEGFVGKYRKVCLPREEIEAGVTPGDAYPVFSTRFGKVGMMVCWDVHFPEVARNLSNHGAEVIAMPIWGANLTLASARAIENQVYLVSSTFSSLEPWCWRPMGPRLATPGNGPSTTALPLSSTERWSPFIVILKVFHWPMSPLGTFHPLNVLPSNSDTNPAGGPALASRPRESLPRATLSAAASYKARYFMTRLLSRGYVWRTPHPWGILETFENLYILFERQALLTKGCTMSSAQRSVSKSHLPDRRRFLRTTLQTSLGTSLCTGADLSAGATFAAPAVVRGKNLNEKLNVAVIGVGRRGGANLQSVSSENIVALCDVDRDNLLAAGVKHPGARRFSDFRKLYEYANEFDAVVVSTCEHTHAHATMPALQLGKHVYCEKPLTHGIWESRVIREAAEKAGVATQMGTQIHAEDNYRRVVELIQSGTIGPIREVHVWVQRTWGWHPSAEKATAAGDGHHVNNRPNELQPVPRGLDWDLWLGPAPARPFNECYVPGPKWYRWWDFGSGTMSDLGSHYIDLVFWALDLKAPLTVEASSAHPVHPEMAQASMQATVEFGPRDGQPPVKLSWYQGLNKPKLLTDGSIPQWGSGHLFVGEKGMILSDYARHMLLPEDQWQDFKTPEPTIPKSIGHHAEWIHACKTGAPTTCDFAYSGWLTETTHLGNVAFRTGKKLQWDSENLRAVNVPEAAPLIRREYRPGWELV